MRMLSRLSKIDTVPDNTSAAPASYRQMFAYHTEASAHYTVRVREHSNF